MKQIDAMMFGVDTVAAYRFGETTVTIDDFTRNSLVNRDGTYHVSAGKLSACEILACRFSGTFDECQNYIDQFPQDVSFQPYYGHDYAAYYGRCSEWFAKTIEDTKRYLNHLGTSVVTA